jgi:hypothetical protein
MKTKKSNDRKDPLTKELDFDKLETVAYRPGWKKIPPQLRSPKHLKEARAKLARKSTSSKSRRRAA